MNRKNLPLAKVCGLLEPGPVVLVTTARGNRRDILAMSWHTMMEFEPPLVGCVISNRNHSFKLHRGRNKTPRRRARVAGRARRGTRVEA